MPAGRALASGAAALVVAAVTAAVVAASEAAAPAKVDYPLYPPAPEFQSEAEARDKSTGCVSCHTQTDRATMHASAAVVLGCTDCHGGDAGVSSPAGLEPGSLEYEAIKRSAHVEPLYPGAWAGPAPYAACRAPR